MHAMEYILKCYIQEANMALCLASDLMMMMFFLSGMWSVSGQAQGVQKADGKRVCSVFGPARSDHEQTERAVYPQ